MNRLFYGGGRYGVHRYSAKSTAAIKSPFNNLEHTKKKAN